MALLGDSHPETYTLPHEIQSEICVRLLQSSDSSFRAEAIGKKPSALLLEGGHSFWPREPLHSAA